MNPDEDLEISKRTWNKISTNVHKDGYREGVSDGKDSSFQKGFNIGFTNGLQNAFKMGIFNGVLRALRELEARETEGGSQTPKELEFEKAHRGLCIMCPGETGANIVKKNIASSAEQLRSSSLDLIHQEQKRYFDDNISRIVEKYQSVLDKIDFKLP